MAPPSSHAPRAIYLGRLPLLIGPGPHTPVQKPRLNQHHANLLFSIHTQSTTSPSGW